MIVHLLEEEFYAHDKILKKKFSSRILYIYFVVVLSPLYVNLNHSAFSAQYGPANDICMSAIGHSH